MSVGARTGATGHFGAVSGPDRGTVKERSLVDDGQLTEEMREALEADTFIIYGKASVEQYDDDYPPQKIKMEAFADKLDRFLESGMISRRHKDIPVGEPLRSYTLEEPTRIAVADEVLEFDAGDTIESGVRDDEVWIAADLRNDSEIARETRHKVMTGELSGFSVTVFCKEWEETSKGQLVTSIDWHSTTIGGDDQIKNEDSRFGVAEFKAAFGGRGALGEKAALRVLSELPTDMSSNSDGATSKGFWDRVQDIANQKAKEEQETPEDEKSDTGEDEKSETEADEKEGDEYDYEDEEYEMDMSDMSEDAKAVLDQVKSELGDKQASVLVKEMGSDYEDEEYEDEEDDGELKSEDFVEAMKEAGFVTEDQAAEKAATAAEEAAKEAAEESVSGFKSEIEDRLPDGDLATKADVEDVMDAAEKALVDVVPEAQKAAAKDAADEAVEKMATGGTPDPSGGSAKDEQDYMEQIQNKFGSQRGDN
mgnify:CR=1 FL=1